MSGRRRRLTASGRVMLAMSAVMAVAVGALVIVAYSITMRTLTAEMDRALQREASAFSAAVAGAPTGESLVGATRGYLYARTGGEAGLSPILSVVFPQGRVVSNSPLRIEDVLSSGSLETSASRSGLSNLGFDGTTYRVLSVPVLSQGARAGTFLAALSLDSARDTARRVSYTLAAAGLVAMALGVILADWASRRALAPLRAMAAEAAEVTHAQPGRRLSYEGPADELGSLADSVNAMLARLENSFDDQRAFVADASHELRTPVAVIRGNVELLRGGRLEPSGAEESLEMIEHEAVRMGRLLDELLALARLESGTTRAFQPLELRTLVDEVAARARALGERKIVCEGDCDMWVEGDPDLLDQALVNIARNAIAHTSEGGTITLSCSAMDSIVRVSIADDGAGIPEADLERVFDRFYRAPGTSRPDGSGGAGLGLAIARRLVELHGGTISVENVEPHGARFSLELPRIERPS